MGKKRGEKEGQGRTSGEAEISPSMRIIGMSKPSIFFSQKRTPELP